MKAYWLPALAALCLLLLGCARPAAAQSAPTCTAQLIHSPYYPNWGSPTYTGDVIRFHVRLRYHTANTSVSPPNGGEAWVPSTVAIKWAGTYSYAPLMNQNLNKTFTYTFPSAQIKARPQAPPPLGYVIADAVGDIDLGFQSSGVPCMPPGDSLVSVLECRFNFTHMYVAGGVVKSDPFVIVVNTNLNMNSQPVTLTASLDRPIKERRADGLTLAAFTGTRRQGGYTQTIASTSMSTSLIDTELSDTVLAGANTVINAWFAAHPGAYNQNPNQQVPVTIAWPSNVQY